MFPSNFSESLSIYYDNLSWYLIITVCVAGFGVILTICLQLQIPVIDIFDKLTSFQFTNSVIVKPKSKKDLNLATTSKDNTVTELEKSSKPSEDGIKEEKSVNQLQSSELACGDDDLSLPRLKPKNKNELLNEIRANMTPEQQNEEEQIVNEQLAKIFALLKEQEETFKVTDMGDLKEQLSLYK